MLIYKTITSNNTMSRNTNDGFECYLSVHDRGLDGQGK